METSAQDVVTISVEIEPTSVNVSKQNRVVFVPKFNQGCLLDERSQKVLKSWGKRR